MTKDSANALANSRGSVPTARSKTADLDLCDRICGTLCAALWSSTACHLWCWPTQRQPVACCECRRCEHQGSDIFPSNNQLNHEHNNRSHTRASQKHKTFNRPLYKNLNHGNFFPTNRLPWFFSTLPVKREPLWFLGSASRRIPPSKISRINASVHRLHFCFGVGPNLKIWEQNNLNRKMYFLFRCLSFLV